MNEARTPDENPKEIYGIDFSGASSAGRKIWLSRCVGEDDRLVVLECRRGDELAGSGAGRMESHASLSTFISRLGPSALGMDFPFGLPAQLVAEKTWERFVLEFIKHYPNPDVFRLECVRASKGMELRRLTDRESRTPFSPYNLRLYRQTYHGIRDVLAPLLRSGMACFPPMQPLRKGVPWVLEICPASTLKKLDLYLQYKGQEPDHRKARAKIVESLEGSGALAFADESERQKVLADQEGDCLDSAVAALATWEALRNPAGLYPKGPGTRLYAIEGYVYF